MRLVAGNRTHADRLLGVLKGLGFRPAFCSAPAKGSEPAAMTGLGELLADEDQPPLAVLIGGLTHGFRLPGDRLALIAEAEIFGPKAHREARQAKGPGLGDLGEIAEGDLVVHAEHGIGRYRGLKKLDVRVAPGAADMSLERPGDGFRPKLVAQDFLLLEYDGGNIYLPVYRIGQVRRYIGQQGETARLDKLGGKTWQEKRRRVSAEARKVAEELLQLYAQRQALPGHAFPGPDVVFQEFEETFPFEETPDQAKAIDAVLDDMQHGPADGPPDSAATSATARPRWRCGGRCWRCWGASRWRCWRRPRCWPSSTSSPSASACATSRCGWGRCPGSAARRSSARRWRR